MATLIDRAHAAVSAACPGIIGISIPNRADKSTWRISFADDVTENQRAAANAALLTVDESLPDTLDVLPMQALTGRGEARRRILAVLKDEMTQINLTALATALTMKRILGEVEHEDIAAINTLRAAHVWVSATLIRGRALDAEGSVNFGTEEDWPAPPPGLSDLVSRM